jgi:hypothetical protein
MASYILAKHGPASVITANNIFAHIDDLGGVLDGVFVFEVWKTIRYIRMQVACLSLLFQRSPFNNQPLLWVLSAAM